jgi:hypothetical protein
MSEKQNLEEHLKQLEIKLKEKELNKKWFENPINGTIFLGFITIVFNLIINSCNNKKLSDLEKDKFEYSVYLKALESDSQENAVELIEFYEGLGIIKPNKFTLKKIEEKSLPIYNYQNKLRFNEIYNDIFVLEDINGDNKKDTVVYHKPKLIDDNGDCLGDCTISFEFSSNKRIPLLKYNSSGSALIESCRDLNGDNINEVLIIKRGMNGTWYGCSIYSLKNNKWILLFNNGSVQDDGLDEIYAERIISEKNNFYFLNDSLTDNGNLKVKIKI